MTSIYILDDNSSVRSSLQILFEFLFNADVKTYARVANLYAQIDELAPGVLLADQQLPDGTGIEVMRTLARRADRRFAMILMSGSVDAVLVEEAKAAGAADVIAKPCSTDILRQVIQRSLPRIRLRSAPMAYLPPAVSPANRLAL